MKKFSFIGIALLLLSTSLIMSYGRYYGVTTHQNKRPYQEDRFTVVPGFYNNSGDFFGIYDGHGGDNTASNLQRNLHQYFHKYMHFAQLHGQAIDPTKELIDAFKMVERDSLEECADGSTALAVYIDKENRLYCAWVGDTRAVLEENGKVGFETRDHKPNDPQELQRIKVAGGTVQKHGVWRVGGLAISRSIGDRAIKKKYPSQVIAEPDCRQIQLTEKNHFLIMASDGLWDVVSSQEAINAVQKLLPHNEKNKDTQELEHSKELDKVAQALQNMAIERGSSDNITVSIVQFGWDKKSSENSFSRITRFFNWLQDKRN